jgi:hypothetical protein
MTVDRKPAPLPPRFQLLQRRTLKSLVGEKALGFKKGRSPFSRSSR